MSCDESGLRSALSKQTPTEVQIDVSSDKFLTLLFFKSMYRERDREGERAKERERCG